MQLNFDNLNLPFKFNPLILMNAALDTDSYKLSHKFMEPEGTERIYDNFTPRTDKYFKRRFPEFDGKVVVYGIQVFILNQFMTRWKVGFFDRPKAEVLEEIREILFPYLGMDSKQIQHFAELHDLGYLPLRVKSLPEGTLCPIGVPMLTIENTDPRFSWLPNYCESVFSAEVWKAATIATTAREFRRLANKWWDKTVVDHTFKKFAFHDFSFRGHADRWSSAVCGAGTLLSFNGTDNVPAVVLARAVLGAGSDVASSVPASEHSVTTLGINHYGDNDQELGEYLTLERLLTSVFPAGLLSYVSDSYDYWRVLTSVLPRLKHILEKREGKLVIRPDSGDPVDIVVGTSRHVIELEELDDLYEIMLNAEEDDRNTYIVKGTDIYVELSDTLFDDRREYGSDQIVKSFGSVESILQFNYLSQVALNTDSPEWKGSIQVLWELFGGTVNEKGYKELPPYIGLIYGDGITFERAEQILEGLAAKGFAASNVVFGVGSYSYAGGTRDDLGFAIKATNATVNGQDVALFKDPKTDDGSKKSAKGLLKVDYDEKGTIKLFNNVSREEEKGGLLEVIFEDGEIKNFSTFPQMQERLMKTLETGW